MSKIELTAKQIARLAKMGIKTDKEPIARKKLLQILTQNDVPDVEDETIDSLIDMASVFVDSVEEELEEEVEETPKKNTAKKGAKVKKAVEEEEEEEQPEEEEMDDLTEEVATKKLTPAKKKATAKKKTTTHKRKLEGTRWEDLTDEQRVKALKPFYKVFPKDKFEISVLQKSFTVSYLGKSGKQSICKYHLLRLLEDGKLEGVFVSHRFKTPAELLEYLPEGIEKERTVKQGDSCSYLHPFGQDEVFELLTETDFLTESVKRAQKADVKMQTNRENLEKSLKSGKLEKTKPTAKKVAEEEEEEEEPTPKTTVKKTAKKQVVEEPEEEEVEEEPTPKKTVKVTTKPVKKQQAVEEEEEEEEEVVSVKKKGSVKPATKGKKK